MDKRARSVSVVLLLAVSCCKATAPAATTGGQYAGQSETSPAGTYTYGQQCSGTTSVRLLHSCFSDLEATQFRANVRATMQERPDVQLLFFYLNLRVDGEVFYPGLCCWNHDQSADGETPLAWVWWRDLSGKAYLDMSLQHVDMWMLPLVTMQRNVHVVSSQTLTANTSCWRRRSGPQRRRDLAMLLSAVVKPADGHGGGEAAAAQGESALCWREQIAAFHPLGTLLWGALSPWGANVVQYHVLDGGSLAERGILQPQWTIQWLTFMLRCLLYGLALFIPLPLLVAWQYAHERAVAESRHFCMREHCPGAPSLNAPAAEWLRQDGAPLVIIRSMLNPHRLPHACLLLSWRRLQSVRLWFLCVVGSLVSWQVACVWWTSMPGSIDVCERCLPAAKHKLLMAMLLLIGLYVWLHLPTHGDDECDDDDADADGGGTGRTPRPSERIHRQENCNGGQLDPVAELDEQAAEDSGDWDPDAASTPTARRTREETDGGAGHKYRITLRTLSLTYFSRDAPIDCDSDLSMTTQHGTSSFVAALHDALLLSTGVLPSRVGSGGDPSDGARSRGKLGRLLDKVVHVVTIVRVSPLFLIVSMFLQSNSYLSVARREQQSCYSRWLFKALTAVVFVFMWCFAVWQMHDLFHVLAYAIVGFVINAKLFVPWLVLLLSLCYQLKAAHDELYQPFVAIKATVLEEYVRDSLAERPCSRVVEHLYTALVLRMVALLAGSFQNCQWEARALQGVSSYDSSPRQQVAAVFKARFVKVLVKWLLFACAVQLLLLLMSSVYGIETLPAYLQLLARVAPLGLTWMVSSLAKHNPLLMIRMLQASHARSIMNDLSRSHACACLQSEATSNNTHDHSRVE